MGKARRLAQRVRRRREPGEEAPPEKAPVGEADGTGGAAAGESQAPLAPEDDAAARIDAARARLRATIEPPADPDG